jgi:hypothetical protein
MAAKYLGNNFMANSFRGNDTLVEMKFLGNVSRDIVITGTVIGANDFRFLQSLSS